jgi:hypothetical protein
MKKILIIFSLFLTISCKENKVTKKVIIVDKFTTLRHGYTQYNIAFKPVGSSRIETMDITEENYFNLEKGYSVTLSINN